MTRATDLGRMNPTGAGLPLVEYRGKTAWREICSKCSSPDGHRGLPPSRLRARTWYDRAHYCKCMQELAHG